MELAVLDGERIVGQFEISFQPFEECRLKDSAPSVERVTGQPDEFRFAKAQFADVLQLFGNLFSGEHVCQTYGGGPIEERKRHSSFRVMLPDELQHQELVEIGVQ